MKGVGGGKETLCARSPPNPAECARTIASHLRTLIYIRRGSLKYPGGLGYCACLVKRQVRPERVLR